MALAVRGAGGYQAGAAVIVTSWSVDRHTPRSHVEYEAPGGRRGITSIDGAATNSLRIDALGDGTDTACLEALTGGGRSFRIVGQCDKHPECCEDIMVGIGCWLDNVKGGKW